MNSHLKMFLHLSTFALIILYLSEPGFAQAQEKQKPADFYKGKTITWYVNTQPGGGFDAMSRTLAPIMEKHTGATVVVINKPGGDLMLAPKYLYDSTKPDGLSVCILHTLSAAVTQVMETAGFEKIDMAKFNWLGSINSSSTVIYINPQLPYKSLADLKGATKEIRIGSTGAVGTPAMVSRLLLQEALGAKSKVILGFESSTRIALAVSKGEVDGGVYPVNSILRFAKEGLVRPLVVLNKKRNESLPQVPTIYEAIENLGLTEDARFWIDRIVAFNEMYRSVVTTPGVPSDRVEFLRQGIQKAFHDEKLMEKRQVLELDYTAGDAVAEEIQAFVNMDAKRKALFKSLMVF